MQQVRTPVSDGRGSFVAALLAGLGSAAPLVRLTGRFACASHFCGPQGFGYDGRCHLQAGCGAGVHGGEGMSESSFVDVRRGIWGSRGVVGLAVLLVASLLVVVEADEASAGTTLNPATLTSGFVHTCAIDSGGQVFCWGRNLYGQLGDGSTTTRTAPTPVVGISDATAVVAGQWHTCAVVTGGAVKCWGNNDDGQLGNGTAGADEHTPVIVSGLTSTMKLTASFYNTCALDSIGQVRCWGEGASGQNGNGSALVPR